MSDRIVLSDITDDKHRAEAERMVKILGEEHVIRLALLPNFQGGAPFSPARGYVLKAKETLPFNSQCVDQATLFRGRAIHKLLDLGAAETRTALESASIPVPLITERVTEKITPTKLVSITHRAIATALNLVNASPDTDIIPLTLSEAVQCSIALIDDVRSGDVYIFTDLHALPQTNFLPVLFEQSDSKRTMSETLMPRDPNDSLRTYHRTLGIFYTLTGIIARRFILEELLGSESAVTLQPAPPSLGILATASSYSSATQYMTNTLLHDRSKREIYYYSEAYDLELGGILYAGPYRELIIVDRLDEGALARAAQEPFCAAFPADAPTTISPYTATESALQVYRSLKKKEKKARKTGASPPLTVAMVQLQGSIYVPEPKVDASLKGSSTMITSGPFVGTHLKKDEFVGSMAAARVADARASLAWASPGDMPLFTPESVASYRVSFENPLVGRIFERLGIKISKEGRGVRAMRIIVQALGPVPVVPQLLAWRAVQSESIKRQQRKQRRHETSAPIIAEPTSGPVTRGFAVFIERGSDTF